MTQDVFSFATYGVNSFKGLPYNVVSFAAFGDYSFENILVTFDHRIAIKEAFSSQGNLTGPTRPGGKLIMIVRPIVALNPSTGCSGIRIMLWSLGVIHSSHMLVRHSGSGEQSASLGYKRLSARGMLRRGASRVRRETPSVHIVSVEVTTGGPAAHEGLHITI